MAEAPAPGFIEQARSELTRYWNRIQVGAPTTDEPGSIPVEVQAAIARSINSSTLTYRYVLPTQLLAKCIEPGLDCRSIQVGSGLRGAFDARSLCHTVVVDFDRANSNVLGGSKEPYLNNPLRIAAIVAPQRKAQRNKTGFDDLCLVLGFAEAHPDVAPILLEAVLRAVHARLANVQVVYPVPNRVSLAHAQRVLSEFLAERSGGARLQAVAVALFRTIGRRLGLCAEVESANINAADQSTGRVADIECRDDEGGVVLAVGVKDRQIELKHVQDKLPGVRERGIRELLFLVQGGVRDADDAHIKELVLRQFTRVNPILS